jgi:hypothetical protein
MTGSKALAFRAEFPAPILVPTSRVYPFFFCAFHFGGMIPCVMPIVLLLATFFSWSLWETTVYWLRHLITHRCWCCYLDTWYGNGIRRTDRAGVNPFFFIFTILLCLNKCFPQNFANVTLNRGSAGNRRLCGGNQLKWRLDLKFTLNLFCTTYEPPCGSP